MFHLQQQAQEKDAEVHRQQRELHTLRVRTWYYELAFVTLVEMAATGTQIQKMSSWLQYNNYSSV